EEVPDVLDVVVRHRVVGVVPVHPLAEPNGLLSDDIGVFEDPLPTRLDKALETVLLNLALGVEPQLLLDLDFHPQALAIEAILVALVEALHGPEALIDILVGATPGMMHAHRIVGSDRPIEEGIARTAPIPFDQLSEEECVF